MTTTTNTDIATGFLRSWSSGDFSGARSAMADDITFRGPMGATDGAEAYLDGVRRLTSIVTGVTIHDTVASGDQVCVRYDLVTMAAGAIPTVGWYRLRADGKVTSVEAYFDPRPLLG